MNKYEYAEYLNRIKNKLYESQTILDNDFIIPYQEETLLEMPFFDNGQGYPTGPNEYDMFNLEDGYEKGNLFKNLYQPYKNYQPKNLKPKNEQEELLLKINIFAFAMHEIMLCLNVYPNQQSLITKYHELQGEYDRTLKHYEAKYGPLNCNNEFMTTSPFSWTEDLWPWDRRDY